jgi:hypothetical protein
MNRFFIVCAALALAGCSSSARLLENRVTCTVDGAEAHVVSKWGPVGIAARVADSDAKVVCKR